MEERDVHSLLQELTKERVEGLLDRARRWLGPSWLAQNPGHPLGQLWFRKDWVASTELVGLGFHLERIESIPSSRTFLREVQRHAQSDSAANRTGHLWELFAASMFNTPGHPVELPKANNPGFDFTVRTDEGTSVQFSCKALNPSDNELSFRSFASELEGSMGQLVHPGTSPLLIMVRQNAGGAPLSVDLCLGAARDILERADGIYRAGGWAIVKRRTEHASLLLHAREPSYSVGISSEHPTDEQRRFTSMVQRAIANLTQHCSTLPARTTNAALIKVPSPISISRAEEVTSSLFDATCAHLAGVFLYRTQVVSYGPKQSTFLAHEYRQVVNPHARVPFPPLHLQVPIGLFLTSEPQNKMFVGSDSVDMNNMYMYAGGHLVCRGAPSNAANAEYHFPFGRNHMESVTIVFERRGQATLRVDQPSASPWTTLV